MKSAFGLISLLLVLGTIGLLVKKQMATPLQALPAVSAPATPSGLTTVQQSQNLQQQVQQTVQNAMQQRPDSDAK
jgi:hypothetical protein